MHFNSTDPIVPIQLGDAPLTSKFLQHDRIFASAEYCRRVLRLMSRSLSSVDTLFSKGLSLCLFWPGAAYSNFTFLCVLIAQNRYNLY